MGVQISPRTILLAGLAAWTVLFTAGCATSSEKPKPPQPGTPEFNWLKAKNAYNQGDYVTASNLLVELSQKDSPYLAQAAPLALVLTHGLTHAYLELGEKYAEGAKKTRGNSAPFYRLTSEYRSKASAIGLRYAEAAHKYTASLPEGDVVLAFDAPKAEDSDPPQYKRIEAGMMIPAAEIPRVESRVIARWILKSTANTTGFRDKPEQLGKAYAGGEARVPQATFLPALAFSLYETAEMFGPKKLNQPNRVVLTLCNEAESVLAKVKPSKETAELLKKIKAVQKRAQT